MLEAFLAQLKTSFTETAARTMLALAVAVILLIVGFKLSNWLTKKFKHSHGFQRMDPTARSFLISTISICLKLLFVIVAAGIVGVSTASIVAVLGSAGLAVGLALQGSLSNFAGGVMILLFKPFLVGDYIELPSGEAGTVKGISMFYTTLITPDNRKLVIPNGTVSNSSIVNTSAMAERRVDLEYRLAHGTDVTLVINTLLTAANDVGKFLSEPAPFARLTNMDERALVFTFRGWCKSEDYWQIRFEMQERISAAFDAADIHPPLTQFTVQPTEQK